MILKTWKSKMKYGRILFIEDHLYKCEVGATSMRFFRIEFSKSAYKIKSCSGSQWPQPWEPKLLEKILCEYCCLRLRKLLNSWDIMFTD